MKKIKKLLTISLSVLLMLCMSVSLVGCKKTGLIPNGYYSIKNQNEDVYVFTENDMRDSYCWVIDGDIAEEWVSSSCNYKAKIVEKDGKIYFEGYKWKDLFDILFRGGKEQGNTHLYQVVYNEREQSINLLLQVPQSHKQYMKI